MALYTYCKDVRLFAIYASSGILVVATAVQIVMWASRLALFRACCARARSFTDSLPRGKSDFDAVTFTAEALHPLSSITVASRKLPH
jgi:hypothetical protein